MTYETDIVFFSNSNDPVLLFSACGPTGADTPATEPPPAAEAEAATEAALTEAPTQASAETEAPAIVPIDLAGPPMEVGSKFTYVDGTVLVAVPGGSFTMGYNFDDNPERIVTVSDFWIYSTEVTNRQYALCIEAGKCTSPDPLNAPEFGQVAFTNFPVTGVTHTQAGDYCAFVKGRLPTEAEWEKTARGPDGNIFPWGNGVPSCSLTNYANCERRTTSVNDYPDGRSYYEAWDMGGNIREWVADWYEPLYNVENPVADPLGPDLGEKRSVRSAGFTDSANVTVAAHRFSLDPEATLPDLGFRCIVEDPTAFAPWCEIVGYAGTNPDGTPGSCTPQVKCNDVSITVVGECGPTTNFAPAYAIVTFELSNTPPDVWTYDAPGCSPIAGEQTPTKDKYLCLPPGPAGPATATGTCTDISSCVATCPVNYDKVGDTCVWNGGSYGSTECLPGSTYDPLTQCCSATPGSAADLSLCPAGYFELGGVCVPNPKGVVDALSVPIEFNSCTPDTGGKDPNDPGDPGGGDPGGSGPCPPGETYVCSGVTAVICRCQKTP